MTNPSPVIRTQSGLDVPLWFATPEHISPRDICCHLSRLQRFNGATSLPYSVAQHSVLVATILTSLLPADADPALVVEALLHDAHEAYLGDITTPVEQALFIGPTPHALTQAKARFDLVIRTRFGLPPLLGVRDAALVKHADRMALATEWRDLMPGSPPPGLPPPAALRIKPLPWDRAEERFRNMLAKATAAAGLPDPFAT